ncbi:MAG: SBBP repeat-containing protein [Proteobacteria bacterium]|nr:SBBP repeat-containing protein [Pseudomonadota bacterium]
MRRLAFALGTSMLLASYACGGGTDPAMPGTGATSGGGGATNPCASVTPPGQELRSCQMTGIGSPETWARCVGSMTDDDGNAIGVDLAGNIYLGVGMGDSDTDETRQATMCFGISATEYGTVDFGGMALSSDGDEDPALAKYDRAGNLIWVKSAPGMGGEGEVRAVAVDPVDGSVIAVGDFQGAAAWDPNVPLVSQHRDLFIAEFFPDGTLAWSQTAMVVPDAMGNGDADAWGVAVVPSTENIIVTGDFEGTITFGATTPQPRVLTAQGTTDMFVAEFDKAGNVLWADDAGGQGDRSVGRDITIEPGDGSELVVGTMSGSGVEHITDQFGGDIALTPIGTRGDMILVHYDALGKVMWATHAGNPTQRTRGEGVGHDSLGNVYVTGRFTDCAFFPMTPVVPNLPAAPFVPAAACVNGPGYLAAKSAGAGDADWFIVKYDPSGIPLWVKTAGGLEDDRGYAIEVYDPIPPNPAAGPPALYVGGRIQGTATFGTPPGPTLMATSPSTGSGFGGDSHAVAKYDLEGNLLWVKTVGGTGDNDLEDIAVDPTDGAVVGTGNFAGTAIFQGGIMLQSASGNVGNNDDDILFWRFRADGN